jgi:hypothetical protein
MKLAFSEGEPYREYGLPRSFGVRSNGSKSRRRRGENRGFERSDDGAAPTERRRRRVTADKRHAVKQ